MIVIGFGLTAAASALLRWRIGQALPSPLGTMLVNIVGAFGLGLLDHLSGAAATIVAAGGIGALTTFSALAHETRELARSSLLKAASYLAVTLTAGLAAVLAGVALAPEQIL